MKIIPACWAKTIVLYISLSIFLGLLLSALTLANTHKHTELVNKLKNIEPKQIFVSQAKQTQLIELYSSQGCSSCPPAQQWVNNLANNARVWKDFIPLVFHVDYWDYIGWKDRYSSSKHSQRQRKFAEIGATNSVYTPGFMVNGKEWRAWFTNQDVSSNILAKPRKNIGILHASLQERMLQVGFDALNNDLEYPLYVNVAVLGMDSLTDVRRGENANRQLHESFIVLAHTRSEYQEQKQYALPDSPYHADKLALAVWLTQNDTLTPIQAVGGPLVSF